MFVSKPQPAGQVTKLDGAGVDLDVENLATDPAAQLLQAQDFGLFGNPDGAQAGLVATPAIANGVPQGNLRSESVSGRGVIQKTAKTTAPMSNPFPSPTSSTRTGITSIKK